MACPASVARQNDALAPLWRAAGALYPTLYASCDYAGDPPACDAAARS